MCKDINLRKNKVRTKQEENIIIKLALSQVNLNIFVYDIFSQTIEFIDNNLHPFGKVARLVDVATILNSKIIDPNYVDKFNELFDKIINGENFASAIIKIHFLSRWTWQNIILTTYFDSSNNTTQIIGTIHDVSNRVVSEQKYFSEQRFRQTMFTTHRIYEVNLTSNRFMKLESIQDTTDYGTWSVYTEAIDSLRVQSVLPEDWDVFSTISSRANLLAGFAKGQTEFYCEYRTSSDDGELLWASSTTHLLKDPLSGDIKGFIYVQNIDAQKKQELYLREQAEKDPLTGIYNRLTAEKLITEILEASDTNKTYGFLTIDIDNFKQVNDSFGHIVGDHLLQKIANSFQRIVRSNDLSSRIGGDEFIVFINGVNHICDILDIAERLGNYVRNISIDGNELPTSLSIGIAIYPFDGKSFTELYKNSDIALYRVKNEGKDNISTFSKTSCGNTN